jgi:Fic family protein
MKSVGYKNRVGNLVKNTLTEDTFMAYVPKPLPPIPKIDFKELNELLELGQHSLGLLDGAAIYAPNISVFLYSYIRKEAVLSSQIEGTQSSLSDLLMYENDECPGTTIEDVEEVSNYVSAINYGVQRLKELPLSLRLFCEIHEILLKGARGRNKSPGEFRVTQNWIGGSKPSNAVFVPPPPIEMKECLSSLEKFIHEDRTLPTLIKIGLFHVQFETIHPFLDGNGRLGRLLITLMLINSGLQMHPLLYLSLYLKDNKNIYFELLQKVRTEGCWEEWLSFF